MSNSAKTLLIHATNVTGLGASRVAWSLLEALAPRLEQRTHIYLPAEGVLSDFRTSNERVSVHHFRRSLPNALSRAIECSKPSLYFPKTDQTLVLGDIPLRGRRNQTVFVHQPNLIKPAIDAFSGSSPSFRVSRALFEQHLLGVSNLVVQSEPMKGSLEQSYPAVAGRTQVIPHPAPSGAEGAPIGRRAVLAERSDDTKSEPLRLFYPAAGYPHKNHALLRAMHNSFGRDRTPAVQIIVTLTAEEAKPLASIPWVRNVGRLSAADVGSHYACFDALFFPSLLESCGLPLVEAMTLGLPVVCADLPYARWMCGEDAIYFDPSSGPDAIRAIRDLAGRRRNGWQPNWHSALTKLPRSWDAVAASFLEALQESCKPVTSD